ncbi:hypothetical protein CBOM_04947 [Ceraceosorus bombacis]|uniref:Uncharacterized protein n=1 Tax=Ceraceosorus bombacis TaxID=401625 RepID=A0A0P1BI63_9BASI|nr:hypothetical protein CBOM_04947 [Ceraceosorus bombacis]
MQLRRRAIHIALAILLVQAYAEPLPQNGNGNVAPAQVSDNANPSPLQQMVDGTPQGDQRKHTDKSSAKDTDGAKSQQAELAQVVAPTDYGALPSNEGSFAVPVASPLVAQSGLTSMSNANGAYDDPVSGLPPQQTPTIIVVNTPANGTGISSSRTSASLASTQSGLGSTTSDPYSATSPALSTAPIIQNSAYGVPTLASDSPMSGASGIGYDSSRTLGGLPNGGITLSALPIDPYLSPASTTQLSTTPTANAIAKAVIKQLCKMAKKNQPGAANAGDHSIGDDQTGCDLRALFGLSTGSSAASTSSWNTLLPAGETTPSSGAAVNKSSDKEKRMEDFMNSSAGAATKAEEPASDRSAAWGKSDEKTTSALADQGNQQGSTADKSDDSKQLDTASTSESGEQKALFGLSTGSSAASTSSWNTSLPAGELTSSSGAAVNKSSDKEKQMEDFMNSSAGAATKAEEPASDRSAAWGNTSESGEQKSEEDKPKEDEPAKVEDKKPEEKKEEQSKAEEKKPEENKAEESKEEKKPDDKKPEDKKDEYSGDVTVEKGSGGSPPPKREIAYASRDVDVLDRRQQELMRRAEHILLVKTAPLFGRQESRIGHEGPRMRKRNLVWATHIVLQRRMSSAFTHILTGALLIACMAVITVTWANTARRLELR